MNREMIEHRIAELKAEFQKADDEASKLRPRLQFLETMMQRLDGALTVCQELLDKDKESTVVGVPVETNHQAVPVPQGA